MTLPHMVFCIRVLETACGKATSPASYGLPKGPNSTSSPSAACNCCLDALSLDSNLFVVRRDGVTHELRVPHQLQDLLTPTSLDSQLPHAA